MNVQYINPFIEASVSVLKQVAGLDAKLGKVYLKNSPYSSNSIVVIVGLTGEIRGQAIFSTNVLAAQKVASCMMGGMAVSQMDEMSRSAISELANMIIGNTATILYNKGIAIEITPPSLLMGDNMSISSVKTKIICIPLILENGDIIEIDIAAEEI